MQEYYVLWDSTFPRVGILYQTLYPTGSFVKGACRVTWYIRKFFRHQLNEHLTEKYVSLEQSSELLWQYSLTASSTDQCKIPRSCCAARNKTLRRLIHNTLHEMEVFFHRRGSLPWLIPTPWCINQLHNPVWTTWGSTSKIARTSVSSSSLHSTTGHEDWLLVREYIVEARKPVIWAFVVCWYTASDCVIAIAASCVVHWEIIPCIVKGSKPSDTERGSFRETWVCRVSRRWIWGLKPPSSLMRTTQSDGWYIRRACEQPHSQEVGYRERSLIRNVTMGISSLWSFTWFRFLLGTTTN
jgi:hypothetical protein